MAYNHEKYISKALDGFLKQKTKYSFEVLINEDCSTDSTKTILMEYEKKYPEIIKPIYQNENQYSKGIDIIGDFILPRAKGKYFAFCEGDDFWVDDGKLEKQIDFLERNPSFSFCIHNSLNVNPEGETVSIHRVVEKSREVTMSEVILGRGGFCATNSIVAPMALIKKLPRCLKAYPLDQIWQLYLASQGKSYCFQEPMSAYRLNCAGSWSERINSDPNKKILVLSKINEALILFDEDTGYKYKKMIEVERLKNKIEEASILRKKTKNKVMRLKYTFLRLCYQFRKSFILKGGV